MNKGFLLGNDGYSGTSCTLESLGNLKKGQIVEGFDFPNVVHGNRLLFLDTHPFLIDSILLYNNIIIQPMGIEDGDIGFLNSKEKIYKFIERANISELVEKRILTIVEKPLISRSSLSNIKNSLREMIGNNKKIYLSHQLLDFDPFFSPYSNWEETAEYVRHLKQIDLKEKLMRIKEPNLIILPYIDEWILSPIPVIEDGCFTAFRLAFEDVINKWFNDYINTNRYRRRNSYKIVEHYIKDHRKKSYESSIGICNETTFDFPYSLSVILRDIKDGDGPRTFYDTMLDKRKEFEPLRKWISFFDDALKQGDHVKIIRYENEIKRIANDMIFDWDITNQKVSFINKSYPKFISHFNQPINIINEMIDEYIMNGLVNFQNPQRIYLEKMFQGSIINIRRELKRCFPEQGYPFSIMLEYYSSIYKKHEELASL